MRGRAEGLLLPANEGRKPSAYALRLFRHSVVGGLLVLLAQIDQGLAMLSDEGGEGFIDCSAFGNPLCLFSGLLTATGS